MRGKSEVQQNGRKQQHKFRIRLHDNDEEFDKQWPMKFMNVNIMFRPQFLALSSSVKQV